MASIVSNDAARELHVKVSHGSDIRRFRLARADEPAVTLEKLLSALTREYDLNGDIPLHVRYASSSPKRFATPSLPPLVLDRNGGDARVMHTHTTALTVPQLTPKTNLDSIHMRRLSFTTAPACAVSTHRSPT